jgi:hypothetical protein
MPAAVLAGNRQAGAVHKLRLAMMTGEVDFSGSPTASPPPPTGSQNSKTGEGAAQHNLYAAAGGRDLSGVRARPGVPFRAGLRNRSESHDFDEPVDVRKPAFLPQKAVFRRRFTGPDHSAGFR